MHVSPPPLPQFLLYLLALSCSYISPLSLSNFLKPFLSFQSSALYRIILYQFYCDRNYRALTSLNYVVCTFFDTLFIS